MSRAVLIDGAPAGRPQHLVYTIASLRRLSRELDIAPTLAIPTLVSTRGGAVGVQTHVLVAFLWAGLSVPEKPGSERYVPAGLTIEGVCEWIDEYCAAHPPLDVGQLMLASAVIDACYQSGLLTRHDVPEPPPDPSQAVVSASDSPTAPASSDTSTIS